MIPTT